MSRPSKTACASSFYTGQANTLPVWCALHEWLPTHPARMGDTHSMVEWRKPPAQQAWQLSFFVWIDSVIRFSVGISRSARTYLYRPYTPPYRAHGCADAELDRRRRPLVRLNCLPHHARPLGTDAASAAPARRGGRGQSLRRLRSARTAQAQSAQYARTDLGTKKQLPCQVAARYAHLGRWQPEQSANLGRPSDCKICIGLPSGDLKRAAADCVGRQKATRSKLLFSTGLPLVGQTFFCLDGPFGTRLAITLLPHRPGYPEGHRMDAGAQPPTPVPHANVPQEANRWTLQAQSPWSASLDSFIWPASQAPGWPALARARGARLPASGYLSPAWVRWAWRRLSRSSSAPACGSSRAPRSLSWSWRLRTMWAMAGKPLSASIAGDGGSVARSIPAHGAQHGFLVGMSLRTTFCGCNRQAFARPQFVKDR